MKLEEVLQKATPLPFVPEEWLEGTEMFMYLTGNKDEGCTVAKLFNKIYDERRCPEEAKANAALIAHCVRNFVPLLKEVQRLNRLLDIPDEDDESGDAPWLRSIMIETASFEEVEGI